MITTAFLDSLGYTTCQCHLRITCKFCKACEDDLEANAISIFGFDHLRNFVAMREEQARQCTRSLTDRKELLDYLQTQPALMQLLEDIMLSPADVDQADIGRDSNRIRRTKMLRIIRAWKNHKTGWDDVAPTDPGNYLFICNENDFVEEEVEVELRPAQGGWPECLYAKMDGLWNPVSYWHDGLTKPMWRKL